MIKQMFFVAILVATSLLFPAHSVATTTTESISASAGRIRIGAQWRRELTPGIHQDYNFFIEPGGSSVDGAYMILVIHPDTRITSIQSSDGLICTRHDDASTIVMCSADSLSGRELLTISGGVYGAGDNGRYVIFRVGDIINGSDYALALDATYYTDGTIPPAPTPTPVATSPPPLDTTRQSIYLPMILGGTTQ